MSEVGQMVSFKAIDNICAHVNAECENGCGTKVRALLQQYFSTAPPAVWSRERPTEPGWYWRKYTASGQERIAVVQVIKSGSYLVIDDWGGLIEAACGEWSPPLRPPVEGPR